MLCSVCILLLFIGSLNADLLNWSKSSVYTLMTLKCEKGTENYLPPVQTNIARMSSWFASGTTIVYASTECQKIVKQLWKGNDSLVFVDETFKSLYRTHRIAYGRTALLNKTNELVAARHENPQNVFLAVIDPDRSTAPLLKDEFYHVMDHHDLWDSVSFNRPYYYDIWALRYSRFNFNVWGFAPVTAPDFMNQTGVLVMAMMHDIKKQLSETPAPGFYHVHSAFNAFAIYKLASTANCYYDGMNHELALEIRDKILKGEVVTGIQPEDCEHVFFHVCMKRKNNAKIVIYNKRIY